MEYVLENLGTFFLFFPPPFAMHCRHALTLTLAWRAPYPAHYSPRRCLSLYSPSLAPPPPAPLVSLPPFHFPWQFGCPHPAPRLALPVQASGAPALPSSLSQRYEKIIEGLQAQGARPGAHASAVIFYSTQAATLVLELLPQGGQPSSSAAAHAAALFQCVQWAYRHTLLQLRQELEREAAAASQPAAAALPPQPSSRPWDAPASAAEQWVKLTAQYAVFLARCGPGLLGRPGASQELWTLLDPMLASGVAPSQPTINALLDAALASEDCLGIARLVPALPQLGIVDTEFLSHKVRSVLIECLERRCTRARGGEAVGEDTGALLQAVAAALNPTAAAAAAAGGSEDALNAAFAQVADFLLHPPPLAAYKGSSSLSSEDREGGNSSSSSSSSGSGSGSSMGSELDRAFVLAGVLQKRARLAQRLCLAFPAAGSSRKTLQAAWRAELQLAALKFSRTAGCTPLGSAQGEEEFASVEAMLTLVTGVLEGERSGSGSSWLKACSSAHRELMGALAAGQPGLPREAALAGPSAAVSLLGEAVLTYLLLPKISAAVGGEGGSDYARARELSELCFSLTQQVWEVRGGGATPSPLTWPRAFSLPC